MSEQVTVAAPAAVPASRQPRRMLLILGVLLVLAVAVNGSTLMKIARGEKSLKSVIYGISAKPGISINGWKMPPDTGAANAKVTIEAFLMPGDSCHVGTMLLGRALGTVDPKRIRVKFMSGATGIQRREQVKLGCDQGLAVNGKTKLKTQDPKQPGKQETVYTSHDGGGMAPDKLYMLLNAELKTVYKGKGLPMDATAFATYIKTETKRFEELEVAKARARQEGAKTKQK